MTSDSQIDEIKVRLAKARAKAEKHRDLLEKAELEAAEYETTLRVLDRIMPEDEDSTTTDQKPRRLFLKKSKSRKSIKDSILEVMQMAEKDWWTASELKEAIDEIRSDETPMASISPNLSKLKNDGLIARDNMSVALADRVQTSVAAPDESDSLRNYSPGAFSDTSPVQSGEPAAQGREAVPGGGP